jgi:hypothetical protein
MQLRRVAAGDLQREQRGLAAGCISEVTISKPRCNIWLFVAFAISPLSENAHTGAIPLVGCATPITGNPPAGTGPLGTWTDATTGMSCPCSSSETYITR